MVQANGWLRASLLSFAIALTVGCAEGDDSAAGAGTSDGATDVRRPFEGGKVVEVGGPQPGVDTGAGGVDQDAQIPSEGGTDNDAQSGSGGEGSGGSGGNCVAPVSGPCDTHPQCGCAPGKACDFVDETGRTECYKSNNKAVGNRCNFDNRGDCVSGATCVSGACFNYCSTDADCSGIYPGAVCDPIEYDNGGVTKPIPGVSVCSHQCEPWNTNSCGPGVACLPISDIGTKPGASVCMERTSTGTGACASQSQCAVGYACAGKRCLKWCRVGGSDCAGWQTCYSLIDPTDDSKRGIYVGNTEIGVCGNSS